jgi:polysaccharide biosynthesis/export protein
MFKFPILAVLAIATGVGVMGQQQRPESTAEEKKDTAAKAPEPGGNVTPTGVGVDPNTYQLGAEDVIYVSVWHDADFSKAYLIRPDGKISMQLVDEIQAAGLTPKQLAKAVADKLTQIIKDPQVDVSVLQVNSKYFYVQGEVNKTGKFPLTAKTTVMEALANCGGFRDFANTKKITILRKGQRIKFNWNDVRKGKKLEQNIELEHGDYIIVP